jgi:colanic acid biosynthesis glycosyl transferase WcaI
LRILVISQVFWPEDFRINDLVSELVARGHSVTVLTGLPNYPDGQLYPAYSRAPNSFSRYNGADIVRVPIITRGRTTKRLVLNYLSFALSATLLGAWRLRGRPFDALFVYEPSPITVGVPAVALRALKRAPLVFWVLDLWPDTLRAVGAVTSERVLKAVGWLVTFIYDRCDLILAQSRRFLPEIRKHCRQPRPVAYFPSWAETIFEDVGSPGAREVPIVPDSFNVMFAGNVGEAQDFPAVLDAAELLKAHERVRFLIVGDGRKAAWVRQEVERRGLTRTVLMLGRYPLERMPSFFKHADVMLVSLKAEPVFSLTIPGKIQSYLAAGLPILAMLNGEGAEVIERAGAGITCPAGDARALANAILRMASLSPAQRLEMGRNGRVLSTAEFDRTKLIDQLESWMNELRGRATE